MFSEFQLFPVLVLLAAGQGLFLSLLLIFTNKGNYQANRYLGLFTFVVAINMVDFSIDSTVTEESALYLRTIFWPRDFLYGPALYFYVREMTQPGRHLLAPRQWLHFLPAILHTAIFWSLPFLSAPLHAALLLNESGSLPPFRGLAENINTIETLTSIFHVAVYLWLCVRCLNTHRATIKATFSYDERITLTWLRNLLIGVITVYLIWIFEELLSDLVNLSDMFNTLLGASMIFLVYTMSILGLRQPVIFENITAEYILPVKNSMPEDKVKYKTSSLSDDLSQQLIDELQNLMSHDKPYLNSQLSLPQLADQLGVSGNYLSQIINEQLQKNFFEFVNSYRVDEAKTNLIDEECRNKNILTIALDAGFKSKSSFYTAFKKHTGLTPGEYRKRN